MINKVLVATDGSRCSNKAVDYAVDLSKDTGSEILALYVISLKTLEIFALGHHDDIQGYETANVKLRQEGEDALLYAMKKGKEIGVNVSTYISRGYPADEIIKMAEKEKVDLIVIGSIGKTGLEHLLIGSVSENVVRKAPCPVLVVREKNKYQ
jgi:nucleotide-binding universal stress UspA family protein